MTHRARRKPASPDRTHATWVAPVRECPWCGSRSTVFVQRGLAGGQESKDQFIRCQECEKVTYDIVSKNDRDIRINRYHSGGSFRDPAHQTRYTIYRMLKVGFNEFLLYLRPVLPEQEDSTQ